MICRICGHRNAHSSGRCANCGYDLGYQTLPLDEQRKSLQKRLEKSVGIQERMPMTVRSRSRAGYVGALFALLGVGVAIYIVFSYDRAVLDAVPPPDIAALQEDATRTTDSLPLFIGSDIVYVMSRDGSTAVPRTNLDLQLIPEGSTAAVLCHRSVPYNSLVVFIERKLLEFKGVVSMDRMCCWTDSAETRFISIPLVDPPDQADSLPEPVVLKFIVMDDWLVGRVEEFNVDITAPLRSGFSEAKFDSLLNQVERRLRSRTEAIEQRNLDVWAMFPEESTVGDVVDILEATASSFDSLGYRPFRLKYFRAGE
ncbi:hypothetical protein JW921_11490 [Candidatus Fermentibacterales bacterium]|nr:hypothetical protein [Candidatus Fermentibacterales bacterium]